jgi:cbb3-type cytochrome oxidase cytochrome c subunit
MKTHILPIAASEMTRRITATAALAALQLHPSHSQAQLVQRLQAEGVSQERQASHIVLHVPKGGTPSPFIPTGPFTAEWNGWLNLDLRADYQFQARHAGAFSLEINGTTLFHTPQTSSLTDWSHPVRLKKGTNSVRVLLSRTNDSETSLRLLWRGRGVSPAPIPPDAFGPALPPGDDPKHATPSAQRGRDMFLLHRCGKCHAPEVTSPVPDLAADAPSFVGIGTRRSQDWMARWMLNPTALQSTATMPALLHGPSAQNEAADIAAWLGSLTNQTSPQPPTTPPVPAIGGALVQSLLCRSCHTFPAESEAPEKMSLRSVPEKFVTPGNLTAYLQAPEQHYAWSRMPNFQLSAEDAGHIASFILQDHPAQEEAGRRDADPDRLRRGRELARDRGCFRCHSDPSQTSPQPEGPLAPSVSVLARTGGITGCLAEPKGGSPGPSTGVPRYSFSSTQRADLAAFLRSGNASLGRHESTDFAARWIRELRCGECHSKTEGLPRLEGTGEKLRPEWISRLLSGKVSYKPRPWLASRMPSFPAFANRLAEGLAALEGLPAQSEQLPPPEPEAAAVGRKLVSASAGFACVTCHAIGSFSGSAIFEAPGVNLAHTVDRLRPDFFMRWVRNPQSFDPATKMPLYFDEDGNSALADYFGGDGPKTLQALWEYLRPGPQTPAPEP